MSHTFSLKPGDWTLFMLKPCKQQKYLAKRRYAFCTYLSRSYMRNVFGCQLFEYRCFTSLDKRIKVKINFVFWQFYWSNRDIIETEEKNAQFSIRSRLELLQQWKQSLVQWQMDEMVNECYLFIDIYHYAVRLIATRWTIRATGRMDHKMIFTINSVCLWEVQLPSDALPQPHDRRPAKTLKFKTILLGALQ